MFRNCVPSDGPLFRSWRASPGPNGARICCLLRAPFSRPEPHRPTPVSDPDPHLTNLSEDRSPRAGAALLAVWLSGGVAAHVAFDTSVPEWVDIPVVLSTWFLVVLTWGFSDAGWIRWPAWIGRVVTACLERTARYRFQTGIDFGGSPEYARRLPPALVRLSLLIGSGIVLLVLFRGAFPGPTRQVLLDVSGALYVPYVTVLWGWSLFLAMAACAVVGVHVNDLLVNRVPDARPRGRLQVTLVLALITAPIAAAAALPAWTPVALVALGALAGVGVLLAKKTGQIRFLWRAKGSTEVHSVGSSWLLGWGDLSLAGVIVLSIVPTTGRLWSGAESTAPLTAAVGLVTAWAGVFALWTWLWVGPVRLMRLGRSDPARQLPSEIEFVAGTPDEETEAGLEARGFRVLRGVSRGHRLQLRLTSEAPRRTLHAESGSGVWQTHPADLLHPNVLAQMRAADRQLRRRELVDGIARLLDSATARRFKSGTGFWFAPHLWYVPAMSRDTDEETSMTVGPPYHKILSQEARRHAYEVFQAVSIDLIFIEDGVRIDAVQRVLLQVFDHFDVWGVDPIEDRHIFSVPGVRAMIHAFEFDAPLSEEGYPEPDYENLARGRVLHIMKDRGGDEVEDPLDLVPGERPTLVPLGALT